MKALIPMLVTAIGGLLGSLYGYLSMLATTPALIASDISIPRDFVSVYQERYFYGLIPGVLIFGWWVGKWRAAQIEGLDGWRKWIALVLLGLILAILGYIANFALFIFSA
jgi:hypothetical protein